MLRALAISTHIVFTILLAIPALAKDDEGDGKRGVCEGVLSGSRVDGEDSLLSDFDIPEKDLNRVAKVNGERYPLTALLSRNPEQNLLIQNPTMALNAAQLFLHLIEREGVEEFYTPFAKEKIRFYKAFSGGVPRAGGRRVIGQFDALDKTVDVIKAQASGLSAYSAMWIGPAGVGKSEFRKVPLSIYASASLEDSLTNAFLTVQYKNLNKIEALRGKYPDTFRPPKYYTPITALPEAVQKPLLAWATPMIEQKIGVTPKPYDNADAQSNEINEAILAQYKAQLGRDLTTSETIQVLNEHMEIVRYAIDQNVRVTLDPQPSEPDFALLFGQPNALSLLGQSTEPHTHNLRGGIVAAHRLPLGMDEFWTNDRTLLKKLLNFVEDRESKNGGPGTYVDVVITAFSNDVDLEQMIKRGHTAMLNRFKDIPVRAITFPTLNMDLLMYSLGGEGFQQKIVKDIEAPIVPYNHSEVLPIPRTQDINTSFPGPDYRYRLYAGQGDKQVLIAPHALRFAADLVTMTRFITDPQVAAQVAPATEFRNLAGYLEFSDPVARLRMLHGESSMKPDPYFAMLDLSKLMGEGDTKHPGILTRDALKWWSEAVTAAQESNHKTLTADLLFEIFKKEMTATDEKGGFFQAASNEQRLAWFNLINRLKEQWLQPTIQRDVYLALGSGNHYAKMVYDMVLLESQAIEAGETNIVYNGKSQAVNKKRFDAILEIYKNQTGQDLNRYWVGKNESQWSDEAKARDDVPHSELYKAVVRYLAKEVVEVAKLQSILYALNVSGSRMPEAIEREADSFLKAMWNLGYNRYAAVNALSDVVVRLQQTAEVAKNP